ncbi:hypothetical protein B0H13DRAFT_1864195 [Mycena leptocephala]|nr:hypothetical protein B0H13DRAFT_1864195 [Mycena leptocephala]
MEGGKEGSQTKQRGRRGEEAKESKQARERAKRDTGKKTTERAREKERADKEQGAIAQNGGRSQNEGRNRLRKQDTTRLSRQFPASARNEEKAQRYKNRLKSASNAQAKRVRCNAQKLRARGRETKPEPASKGNEIRWQAEEGRAGRALRCSSTAVSDVVVFSVSEHKSTGEDQARRIRRWEENKKSELTASNYDLSSVKIGPAAAAFVLPPLCTRLLSRRSPCPYPSKTLACLSLGTSFWNCAFGACFLWPHCALMNGFPNVLGYAPAHCGISSHSTFDANLSIWACPMTRMTARGAFSTSAVLSKTSAPPHATSGRGSLHPIFVTLPLLVYSQRLGSRDRDHEHLDPDYRKVLSGKDWRPHWELCIIPVEEVGVLLLKYGLVATLASSHVGVPFQS